MNGVSEGCRDVKINTSNRTQSKQNLEDTLNQGNFWRLDAGINVETVGSKKNTFSLIRFQNVSTPNCDCLGVPEWDSFLLLGGYVPISKITEKG